MTVWLDAQLSPRLAQWLKWLTETFSVTALAVRDVGLRDADDAQIYREPRMPGLSSLPRIVTLLICNCASARPLESSGSLAHLLTCGNTSEARLQEIFNKRFATARNLIEAGDTLVEITGE